MRFSMIANKRDFRILISFVFEVNKNDMPVTFLTTFVTELKKFRASFRCENGLFQRNNIFSDDCSTTIGFVSRLSTHRYIVVINNQFGWPSIPSIFICSLDYSFLSIYHHRSIIKGWMKQCNNWWYVIRSQGSPPTDSCSSHFSVVKTSILVPLLS